MWDKLEWACVLNPCELCAQREYGPAWLGSKQRIAQFQHLSRYLGGWRLNLPGSKLRIQKVKPSSCLNTNKETFENSPKFSNLHSQITALCKRQ